MILIYGESRCNPARARRIYAQRFPARRLPSRNAFVEADRRLLETGNIVPKCANRGRRQRIAPETEEQILHAVEEDPSLSIRKLALRFRVSIGKVHSILKEQLLHPYHIQRVQQLLLPADFLPRENFCRWFIACAQANPNFTYNILSSDEATFTQNGLWNFHNSHIWSDENPHCIIQRNTQHRFSINVWVGIIGDFLIGPCILPQRLTGQVYLDFLVNNLQELLEDVPYATRLNMWYLHDGAPAHSSRMVVEYLHSAFGDRWIGRNDPHNWLARTPDLNPIDFFFWGHLKSLVYATDIIDENDLRHKIFEGANTICQQPGIFQRVRENWFRRCQLCVERQGGHFQQLL